MASSRRTPKASQRIKDALPTPSRRSSRLIARSRTARPPSVPNLPPEIFGLIASHLDKADLKILRLVSKTWRGVATPLLFDRVHVSPRSKDLEVFEKITGSPALAGSVKELVYDVSTFYDLSPKQYFRVMCREIKTVFFGREEDLSTISQPPHFYQLIAAVVHKEPALRKKYGNNATVLSGFTEWQRLVDEQCQLFESGLFFCSLRLGLSKLSNLKSVNMDDDVWGRAIHHHGYPAASHSHFGPPVEGSPHSRQWKFCHPYPRKPQYTDHLNRFDSLKVIVDALWQSQRRIHFFRFSAHVCDGLHPDIFGRYKITDDFPHRMQSSLWQLERLVLTITPQRSHSDTGQLCDNQLGFFPDLLSRMTGLKCLFLDLRSSENVEMDCFFTREYEKACYSYEDVFPRATRWPNLIWLYIRGLAISGLDLCYLLFYQAGAIERLWLCHIDLLEGAWEGVIELLSHKRPWTLLGLQGIYRQANDEWWPCHPNDEQAEGEALGKHLDYIMYGGRHPSLSADADPLASGRYLCELWQNADVGRRIAIQRAIKS
ncbi:MAG: hypothetical protein Q9170_003898 [Blastenia crenularia]